MFDNTSGIQYFDKNGNEINAELAKTLHEHDSYSGYNPATGAYFYETKGRRPTQQDALMSFDTEQEELSSYQQRFTLRETLVDLQKSLPKDKIQEDAGSTAILVAVTGNQIITAGLGDSTAHLVIEDADGNIIKCKRLNRMLHQDPDRPNVLIQSILPQNQLKHAFIPDTFEDNIEEKDIPVGGRAYIIVACDGLSERAKGSDDSEYVKNLLAKNKKLLDAQRPQTLATDAYNDGSGDNISTMFVPIDFNKKTTRLYGVFDGFNMSGGGEFASQHLANNFKRTFETYYRKGTPDEEKEHEFYRTWDKYVKTIVDQTHAIIETMGYDSKLKNDIIYDTNKYLLQLKNQLLTTKTLEEKSKKLTEEDNAFENAWRENIVEKKKPLDLILYFKQRTNEIASSTNLQPPEPSAPPIEEEFPGNPSAPPLEDEFPGNPSAPPLEDDDSASEETEKKPGNNNTKKVIMEINDDLVKKFKKTFPDEFSLISPLSTQVYRDYCNKQDPPYQCGFTSKAKDTYQIRPTKSPFVTIQKDRLSSDIPTPGSDGKLSPETLTSLQTMVDNHAAVVSRYISNNEDIKEDYLKALKTVTIRAENPVITAKLKELYENAKPAFTVTLKAPAPEAPALSGNNGETKLSFKTP